MGNSFNLHSSIHRPHALLDRRYAQRVPVVCQVTYTAEARTHEGSQTGMLRNLSKAGCQLAAAQPPAEGSRITLTLYLSDGQPPMCLGEVTVCQVQGQVFGVKFPPLTPEQRRRLQSVVLQRARRSENLNPRAAFRLA